MSHDDELRSRISRLAETHDVAPLSVDEVMARRSSGAVRQRLLTAAAVVLLVAGVAGVVALISRDDTSTDVASGGADTETAGDPVEALPTTVPLTTTTVPGLGGDIAATSSFAGGPDWIVAWGDGFLSFGQVFEESSAGFEDLVPDIRDRFPPEIADAVEAAGAVTLQEQIDAVTEAGLIDEATEILTSDPELLAAFNEVQAGGTYRTVAEISPDGVTWTELPDFALPGGSEWAQQVRSDGEYLVVVEQIWDAGATAGAIHVSVTADLVNWTTVDLPVDDLDLPDYVQVDTFPGELALGVNGWYITVEGGTYVDAYQLVPPSVIEEIGDIGYWLDATPDGLVVFAWSDAAPPGPPETTIPATTIPATTIPATTTLPPPPADDSVADDSAADRAVPTTTVVSGAVAEEPLEYGEGVEVATIPWSELPLSYDEYLAHSDYSSRDRTAYVGTWDGSISPATTPPVQDCCTVVGTDAGFLAQGWADDTRFFFSSDGQSWTERIAPSPAPWFNSVVAVEGGVVVVDSDGIVWRAAPDVTAWERVSIDGLPSSQNLWFRNDGGRGVASVVDVTVYDYSENESVPFEAEIEYDGFAITVAVDAGESGRVTVTDLASGETVLDESADVDDEQPDFVLTVDDDYHFVADDGTVIVAIPMDVFVDEMAAAQARAFDEAAPLEEPQFSEPDFWLVASSDGIEWHVRDLDDGAGRGYSSAAINDDVVVLRDWEGDWTTFDLG